MKVKCRNCKTVLNHCPICGVVLNPDEIQKMVIDYMNSVSPIWKYFKKVTPTKKKKK